LRTEEPGLRTDTLLILNPAAGHGRGGRLRDEIRRASEAVWGKVSVEITARPGHAVELARSAAQDGAHRVLAVGGDGTVHEAANGLLQSAATTLPVLGVIPVGTGNDFAKMTGTSRHHPMQAIERLARGTVQRFEVGLAWGEYFVNSLGVGLDANVAERVNGYRHWPGALAYAVAAVQAIAHRKARPLSVETDSEHWELPTTVLEVGVGPCCGGIFYLTPDAKPDDGLLDVCVIGRFTGWFLLRHAHTVLRGKHTALKEVRMAKARRLTIRATDGPLVAHMDGEIRAPGRQELEITLVPAALPVLCAHL
jgi:diacylglycerol kinase (ATP)